MKFKVLIVILLLSSKAFSAGEHEAEAERLLELSGSKSVMETMSDMLLAQQLQQNPALIPYEKVMRDFFEKHLGYDAIKPFYVSLYVQTFSIEELQELNSFYSSPVGKKSIEKMPVLMVKGGEYATKVLQENIAELQQSVAAEAERLEGQAAD